VELDRPTCLKEVSPSKLAQNVSNIVQLIINQSDEDFQQLIEVDPD